MKFLSICSGIEAASAAWNTLGWDAVAFSEIEKFPCAVLDHHYPNVPNLGDMTKFEEWPEMKIDLLCGGTPCQAFSVAGQRKGLEDERGNLSLTFCRIADRYQPEWIVWENVPGVLSSSDNAFGCFLAELCGSESPIKPVGGRWPNAGMVVGPKRSAAYRVFDAQYFGLAQRRQRVFVVANSGNGSPATVLFEPESDTRHTPPSRETRKETSADVGSGTQEGCDVYNGELTGEVAATVTAAAGGTNTSGPKVMFGSHWDDDKNPHPTLNQSNNNSGGIAMSNQEVFSQRGGGLVAHRMTAFGEYVEDETASETKARDYKDATDLACTGKVVDPPDVMCTLRGTGSGFDRPGNAATEHETYLPVTIPIHDQATRFAGKNGDQQCGKGNGLGIGSEDDTCPTLTGGDKHAVAIGFKPGQTRNGGKENAILNEMEVRRLTPTECERLMGFPDNFTKIPYRGKPADKCPDGPRYKALGNSWAVPCARWIGERIMKDVEFMEGKDE